MNELTFGGVTPIGWSVGALVLAVVIVVGAVARGMRRRIGTTLPTNDTRSAAPKPAQPHAIAERRQTTRRMVTPVFVSLRRSQAQSETIEGLLLNASSGGVGLSLPQAISAGTIFEIRLTNAAPSVPWVPVEVTYCVPISSRWKIGCRFLEKLSVEVQLLFS